MDHEISSWLSFFIVMVWLVNGLLCKVLNLVPRHREIVGRILGSKHARLLTVVIGLAETGMAIWILSGSYKEITAVIQMIIIAGMNLLEFFLASDLLLWGRANAIFAFLFIALIYYNEFYLLKADSI